LTCLLHDIATTPKNLRATKLSFEYYGGFIAIDLITKNGGSQDLAESVAEAVIRHQDFIEDGNITTVGQVIQLSTTLGKSRSLRD
jgi:cyanamide hydratase